jgi:hypothetical protein
MLVYIAEIIPNDDAPEFEFVEVHVVFKDDEHSPHTGVEVTLFLKKDDEMTVKQIVDAAIEKARGYLSFVVQFPPTEYHRSESFLLNFHSQEGTK